LWLVNGFETPLSRQTVPKSLPDGKGKVTGLIDPARLSGSDSR
jgi:hypothetical protein